MTRRPFVADLRDLWVDNPFWQQATKLHLKVARCIEKKVLKRAAAIVCATSALTGILTSRYGEVVTDKTSTIFNGYDPADFESPVATGGKKFTIVHGGSILLGSGRDHLPLTQGFVKAMGRSQEFAVKAELVYFGFMDPRNLDNLADSRRNMADPEKIKYLGPISHSEAIEIVRAAGLLIFLGGREIDSRANVLRQETETHSVAAKMLEYLASGRPVLSIAGACPTVDLARDARVGFWCESYDPVKIADHLVELFERFYVKGAALDPDWNLISRYSRKEQAGQFAAIFDTVLTGG
jgi:glycosyltransferase involved in cell wall biosynthesis